MSSDPSSQEVRHVALGVDDSAVDALLRVRDVARLLGWHQATVRRRIADGTLTAVRIGGSVRVRRSVLEEFIASAPARQNPSD